MSPQTPIVRIGNYQTYEVLTKFAFPDVIPYSVMASFPAFSTKFLLPSSGQKKLFKAVWLFPKVSELLLPSSGQEAKLLGSLHHVVL
jgi:hypothetical protein